MLDLARLAHAIHDYDEAGVKGRLGERGGQVAAAAAGPVLGADSGRVDGGGAAPLAAGLGAGSDAGSDVRPQQFNADDSMARARRSIARKACAASSMARSTGTSGPAP